MRSQLLDDANYVSFLKMTLGGSKVSELLARAITCFSLARKLQPALAIIDQRA